jgi:hypothetical protein
MFMVLIVNTAAFGVLLQELCVDRSPVVVFTVYVGIWSATWTALK